MSYFANLTSLGGNLLSELSNIVAPLPEDEERDSRESRESRESGESLFESRESRESRERERRHGQQTRSEKLYHSDAYDAPAAEIKKQAPVKTLTMKIDASYDSYDDGVQASPTSSMVDIELSSDERDIDSISRNLDSSPISDYGRSDTNDLDFNSRDMESRMQSRFQEQLETELRIAEMKFRESEMHTWKKISVLEKENEDHKSMIESLQQQLETATASSNSNSSESETNSNTYSNSNSGSQNNDEQAHKVEDLMATIATIETENLRLKVSIKDCEQGYESLKNDILKLQEINSLINSELTALRFTKEECIKLQHELKSAQIQIYTLQSMENKENNESSELSKYNAELKTQVDELQDAVAASYEENIALKDKGREIEESLSTEQKRYTTLELEFKDSKEEARHMVEEIKQINAADFDLVQRKDQEIESNRQEAESNRREAVRLDEALTESESRLKEAEEVAWQSKAELAEVIFALEQAEKEVKGVKVSKNDLTASIERLQTELAEEKEKNTQIAQITQIIAEEKASASALTVSSSQQQQQQPQQQQQDQEHEQLKEDLAALREEKGKCEHLHSELRRELQLSQQENAKIQEQLQDVIKQKPNPPPSQTVSPPPEGAEAGGGGGQRVKALETENKQLQMIIAQLRNVRKTNKGESDNAVAERDELKAKYNKQVSEVQRLESLLASNTSNSDAVGRLQQQFDQANSDSLQLENALNEANRQISSLSQSLYNNEGQLGVSQSDLMLLRKDLSQRSTETANLQAAINQLEADKAVQVMRHQKDLEVKCTFLRQEVENAFKGDLEGLRKQVATEKTARQAAELHSSDQELYRRKAELEFNKEKKKLQQTLEKTLQQLNNSQQDVIDRKLMANLIVQYFKRRRSLEVLRLIGGVLQFDEDQSVAVGLQVEKAPVASLFASLITSVVGAPARPVTVEGDNLAEQWINFLINETESVDDHQQGGGSPKTSSSSSSSTRGGSSSSSSSSSLEEHRDSLQSQSQSRSAGGVGNSTRHQTQARVGSASPVELSSFL